MRACAVLRDAHNTSSYLNSEMVSAMMFHSIMAQALAATASDLNMDKAACQKHERTPERSHQLLPLPLNYDMRLGLSIKRSAFAGTGRNSPSKSAAGSATVHAPRLVIIAPKQAHEDQASCEPMAPRSHAALKSTQRRA